MDAQEIKSILYDLDAMVELARKHCNMPKFLEIVHSAVEIRRAVEKQIPQPPEYKYYKENPSLWEIYHCQSCNAILLNYELYPTDYCNKCGQKLKGEPE